jgi:hypothetical protein
MREKLKGTWRTYKVFYFSGKIEHHHESFYTEFAVADDDTLTYFHSGEKRQMVNLLPGEWMIDIQKNHAYIFFGKKKMFELITVESADLVLLHILSGEKLFFAKMPQWFRRIQPSANFNRHISPDKEEQETE